jgi:DNA primase
MDVIGVYAAGVRNVVASCGTALTPAQVRGMKRHSSKIVVNFDPDAAGADATERHIQLLIDEGMHVRVLELEAGLDPDEYIKQYGAETYQGRLARANSYFLWLADRARKRFDMSSAEGRTAGYQAVLLPAIRRISDRLERASVAAEVAEYLGLDRNLVLEEFRRTPGQRVPQPAKPAKPPTIPARQLELVRSLVVNPDIRETLLPRIQASQAARKFLVWPVLEAMLNLFQTDPRFTYQTLESKLAEPGRALVSAELFADEHREPLEREHLGVALQWLDNEDFETRIGEIQQQIREAERAGDLTGALGLMTQLEGMKRGANRGGTA